MISAFAEAVVFIGVGFGGKSMPLKGVVVRLMATLTQGKNETHLSKMTKPVVFCVPPTLTVISLIHPSRPLR